MASHKRPNAKTACAKTGGKTLKALEKPPSQLDSRPMEPRSSKSQTSDTLIHADMTFELSQPENVAEAKTSERNKLR